MSIDVDCGEFQQLGTNTFQHMITKLDHFHNTSVYFSLHKQHLSCDVTNFLQIFSQG